MKKYLLIISLLPVYQLICAQEYLVGKVIDTKLNQEVVYYDRSEYAISNAVYQTVYKVMNMQKKLLYTITATHNWNKSLILVGIKSGLATGDKGFTFSYDPEQSGLIFTDKGNLDTAFPASKSYDYLLSFEGSSMDFPVIHRIKEAGGKQIELDPLSKLRIKKQVDIFNKLHPQQPEAKIDPRDAFNTQLLQLRDQFYAQNSKYTEIVSELRNLVQQDITSSFKDEPMNSGEPNYRGSRKGEKPDGKGLLVTDGNTYDGFFKAGKFKFGVTVMHNKTGDYSGEYSDNNFNGTGWLKYENGGFVLGLFKNGGFAEGVTLCKDKNSEIYFGCFKNDQRTGYGELRNPTGNRYYGEFLNGRLIKGYAKEVDQFGYSAYMKIENGTKTAVDPQVAEGFFDLVYVLKQ